MCKQTPGLWTTRVHMLKSDLSLLSHYAPCALDCPSCILPPCALPDRALQLIWKFGQPLHADAWHGTPAVALHWQMQTKSLELWLVMALACGERRRTYALASRMSWRRWDLQAQAQSPAMRERRAERQSRRDAPN